MNVRMKTKKMVITMAVITMMLIINIIPAYASTDDMVIEEETEAIVPAATYPAYIEEFVKLTTGERWDYTRYIEGNYAKVVNGNVDEDSALSVWFVIESGTGGHHDVDKRRVMPGANCPEFAYSGPKAQYRLELNPYGVETNRCKAKGYIRVSTKK